MLMTELIIATHHWCFIAEDAYVDDIINQVISNHLSDCKHFQNPLLSIICQSPNNIA